MPRGVKREVVYTGKALKLHEKIQKLETDLRAAKEELKVAYKEQLKAEKAAIAREKKETAAAAKKALKGFWRCLSKRNLYRDNRIRSFTTGRGFFFFTEWKL